MLLRFHFTGTHKDLADKVEALERKYQEHDKELQVVFNAIKKQQ